MIAPNDIQISPTSSPTNCDKSCVNAFDENECATRNLKDNYKSCCSHFSYDLKNTNFSVLFILKNTIR